MTSEVEAYDSLSNNGFRGFYEKTDMIRWQGFNLRRFLFVLPHPCFSRLASPFPACNSCPPPLLACSLARWHWEISISTASRGINLGN